MLKALLTSVLRSTRKQPGTCPSPEVLAAYVEGCITVEERLSMEDHLYSCEHCLDEVLLCKDLLPSWDRSEERADVVVTFLSWTVEIIRGIGQIAILPPLDPAMVRGGRTLYPNAARFSRSFGETEIQVEVERIRERTADITVAAFRDGNPVNRIRCTLVDRGRELASELSETGRVCFEAVSFNRYLIRMSTNQYTIGELSLVLKEK